MAHTLYHGDCLEVLPTLRAGSVGAVIADPPYASGGRQQANARNIILKNDDEHRSVDEWFLTDNMGSDTYVRWMRQIARECLRVSVLGAHAYVFTDWRQYTNLVTAWESVGWTLRSVVVWDKARGGAMGSFWRNNHEWIAVFAKGAPSPLPNGSFFNTWTGAKPQGDVHPTVKPLGLLRYLISATRDTVLDPFMGSGTTGVACAVEGRDFIGVELDENYFKIAEKRIANAQPPLFPPDTPAAQEPQQSALLGD